MIKDFNKLKNNNKLKNYYLQIYLKYFNLKIYFYLM